MHTKTLQDQLDAGRNKGLSSPFGKILKGTISQAPIKLNVSSIPTKYQNIIFKPNSRPAFGDSKIRFFQLSAQDRSHTPGPGCYNLNNTFSKVQSKKGSGFFASETKLDKLQRTRSHGPGPGAYKIRQTKPKSLKKQNFSKFRINESQLNSSKSTALLSSNIQNSRQIFRNEIQNSKSKPSVGAYQLNPQKILKLKSSYSTFKSKIERFSIRQQQAPPIGIYQVFNRPKPSKSQVQITKKFNNKKQSQFSRQRSIHKAFLNLQKQSQKQRIGPGAYNPGLNSTSKTFKIKDNMHDRFGQLKPIYLMAKTLEAKDRLDQRPQRPQLNKFQMAKTYNSIFKSTTQRWDLKLKNQMDPGIYNANKSPPKKSHLINFLHKWV